MESSDKPTKPVGAVTAVQANGPHVLKFTGTVMDLLLVAAHNWLKEHPLATDKEKRSYREAMNDVLIAMRMFVVAEQVREETRKMFFPDLTDEENNHE